MSLATNIANLATRISTEIKALRTLINGNAGDLNALHTTAKSNLVVAINELESSIAGAGANINDGATNSSSVWSSQKVSDQISALSTQILGGASAAYDTLGELQSLMEADNTETTGILTALGNRVRTDVDQSLDSSAKVTARNNIGAAAAADLTTLANTIGDTSTNFVTTFENGLI